MKIMVYVFEVFVLCTCVFICACVCVNGKCVHKNGDLWVVLDLIFFPCDIVSETLSHISKNFPKN